MRDVRFIGHTRTTVYYYFFFLFLLHSFFLSLSQCRMADLTLLSNEQLAHRIIALSLRTNELSNAIKLSKEHIDRTKNDNQKAIRLEKQATQVRLKEQKTHYEGIVTRHQGFIEQVSIIVVFAFFRVSSSSNHLFNAAFFFICSC